MKVNFALTIDRQASFRSDMIHALSDYLKNFFKDKSYGEDIEDFIIGINCQDIPEGYEKFYKEEKPYYLDDKILTNPHTKEKVRFEKLYCLSFLFEKDEYDIFIGKNDLISNDLLKSKVLKSLKWLDKLPKKVKDFNVEMFKHDMEKALNEYPTDYKIPKTKDDIYGELLKKYGH